MDMNQNQMAEAILRGATEKRKAAGEAVQTPDARADLKAVTGYALLLNTDKDTDVYFCIQGNTGCACLTVEENKTQSYQRRAFLADREGIRGMLEDVKTMYKEKRKQHAPELLQ